LQHIIAGIAAKQIVPHIAREFVITVATHNSVGNSEADDGVIPGSAQKCHGLHVLRIPNGGRRIDESNLLDLPAADRCTCSIELPHDLQSVQAVAQREQQCVFASRDLDVLHCHTCLEEDGVQVPGRGVSVVDSVPSVSTAEQVGIVPQPLKIRMAEVGVTKIAAVAQDIIPFARVKNIDALPAYEQVIAVATDKHVVAIATAQGVIASAAMDAVVVGLTIQRIRAVATIQSVVASGAVQTVVARAAVQCFGQYRTAQ